MLRQKNGPSADRPYFLTESGEDRETWLEAEKKKGKEQKGM